LDETYTALHGRIAELEKELTRMVREQLDDITEGQTQAEADEVRAQLQTNFDTESELAKLQSRNHELEDELRTLAMTRRGNAGSDSDLADRIQEADVRAQEQQAEIERLQDESVAWQRYADESIAAMQAELDAAHDEGNGLKDALLEHGWSAYAPSRKHTMPLMNDQGTQTENRAPSALPKSPVKAVPAPLKATKKQQTHKQVFNEPSNWADRKKAIMQSPSAVEQLESLRVAREKRQAEELERLDQIRQRMEAYWDLDGQSYFPLEAGRVAVVV
jgi:myosin heavy subunit